MDKTLVNTRITLDTLHTIRGRKGIQNCIVKEEFLHDLPLESIVLETDAPYLSPKPHRGKRNESSYFPLILDKIA